MLFLTVTPKRNLMEQPPFFHQRLPHRPKHHIGEIGAVGFRNDKKHAPLPDAVLSSKHNTSHTTTRIQKTFCSQLSHHLVHHNHTHASGTAKLTHRRQKFARSIETCQNRLTQCISNLNDKRTPIAAHRRKKRKSVRT